ncbi:MAG: hypothetical protein LIR46_06135, partial [Bacteroidota bacterium]|nr:hypothetical protein [Bacteroidota bacterium]
MAETIDTRVVEAKFDSKEFEKGVNKTVKKLDELKKSLNLDESGKSLAQLASKTQEATDKASSALEKLENRITSFTGMLKQKLLSGIADEIVGMVFKVRNSIVGMFDSISTAQVGRGMQRYEDMLTSIRTMIANGASESGAYKAIEELNMYADQTSYSIDQLVNLLSQLKTGGVDSLETATQMVEGLSNAAAAAGVNAQRAGIAYYNFAQAYQKGAMLQQDWMSFQNIGMSGEKMNQSIIDAALKKGTLVIEKKDKQGNIISYKTSNKTDKMVRTSGGDARGITAQNMGSKLSSRWFNKAVMEEFTKGMYYFRDISPSELKKYTDLEKAIKEGKEDAEALDRLLTDNGLTRFAYDAFRAGQEARSFTDVLSTLKDVISRGWAKSFELIFGKLDDAKDFFTWLTENELASALYAVGEFRNRVLEIWSESGRADLLASLENIDEIIGSILGNFTIFSGEEGSKFASRTQSLGLALNQASNNFKIFTIRFKEWLDESRGGMSRAERLERFFDNIKRVIKIATDSIYLGFKSIAKIFRELEPVFDAVFIEIGTIAGNIADILNPQNGNGDSVYDHLSNVFNNILKVARPLIKVLPPIIGFLGTIANFFIEMAVGTLKANLSFFSDIFGLILEIFTGNSAQKDKGKGVLDSIREGFDSIAQTCRDALDALSEFFGALIADARRWFGIGEENKDGGLFNNIANFFKTNEFIKSVRTWIKDTAKNVANWIINLPNMIWKGLKKLGVEVRKLWYKIKDLFFGKEVIVDWVSKDKSGLGPLVPVTQRIKGTFAQWLEDTINDIKDWFLDIPNKIKNIWNKIIDFFFGKKVDEWTREGTKDGQLHLVTRRIKSGFSEWMENLIKSIKGWVTSIPEKVKDLWKKVIEMIFGIKTKDIVRSADSAETIEVTTVVKEGLIDWIGHVANKVSEWYEDFKDHIKSIWNKVLDFIFGEQITVEEKDEETGEVSEVHTKRVGTAFTNWISSLPTKVSEWYEDFKDHIKSIWNKVLDFILGEKIIVEEKDEKTDEVAAVHTKRVGTAFTNWISSLPTKASEWYKDFKENIKDLWNKVLDFILGEEIIIEEKDEETGEVSSTHTERVGTAFTKWIKSLPEKASEWYSDMKDSIRSLWRKILGAIFGSDAAEEKTIEKETSNSINQTVDSFSDSVANTIAKVVKALPTKVMDRLSTGLGFVDDFLKSLTNYFDQHADDVNPTEGLSEFINEETKDTEAGPIFQSFVHLGENIRDIIFKTLPPFIVAGFDYIKNQGPVIGTAIKNIFTTSDVTNAINSGVDALGNAITTGIHKIPEVVSTSIAWVKEHLFDEEMLEDGFTRAMKNADPMKQLPHALKESSDKAKKHLNIASIVKDIGTSIKKAFIDVSPYILEGLNEAFTWINDGIKGITDFFSKRDKNNSLTEDIVKEIAKDDPEKQNALLTPIKAIGETLFDLITKTIPNFIEEGVKEVIAGIPKIISKVVGSKETEDSISEGITNATTKMMNNKKQKVTNLVNDPSVMNNLFDWFISPAHADESIPGLYDGAEAGLGELSEIEQVLKNERKQLALIKELEKIRYNLDKEIQDMEKNGTATGMEAGILKADLDYKKRLTEQYLTDIKSGKSDELDFDKIGLDFKKFNEDFEKGLKTEEAETNNFFTNISSAINNISSLINSDGGKTIGFLVAVGFILHELKEVLSVSDELEALTESVKWIGITIAITSIATILGYITYLASQTDTEKFTRVKTIFTDLGQFIKDMMSLFTVAKGFGMAGDFFEMIGDLKGKGVDGEKGGFLANFFSGLLGKIVNGFIGMGLGSIASNVIGSSLENIFEGVLVAVQQIGAAIESIMVYVEPGVKRLAQLNTDLETGLLAFEKLAELIGKFKTLLMGNGSVFGSIDGEMNDTYWQAIYDFQKALDVPDEDNIQDRGALIEKNEYGYVKSIEARIAWLYNIITVIYELGSALSAFEKVEDPIKTMQDVADFISNKDFEENLQTLFSKVFEIIGALTANNFISDPVHTEMGVRSELLGKNIRFISDAMSIFTSAISGLNPDAINTLDHGLDVINQLATMLKDHVGADKSKFEEWFGGDNSIGSFGRAILTFGGNMEAFFGHVSRINVDPNNFNDLLNKTDLVLKVVSTFAEATETIGKGEVENLNSSLKNIDGLGEKMMIFIDEISGYVPKNDINADRFSIVTEALKDLETMLGDYKLVYHDYDLEKIDMIKKVLIGEEGKNNGLFGLFNVFSIGINEVGNKIAQDTGKSFNDILDAFRIFSSVVNELNSFIVTIKLDSSDSISNFNHIIETIETFNSKFNVISDFIENMKT